MNGQGIVLALMLLWFVLQGVSIGRRLVNPNMPDTKTTPGMFMFSLILTVLLALGTIYLASH